MSAIIQLGSHSTIIQLGPHWPTFSGIRNLIIFGDSLSAVGYGLDQSQRPDALQPFGIPYPGVTYNEEEEPNWVGHLLTKYCPAPRYTPYHDHDEQDPACMNSTLLTYNYARGGDTIAGVQYQIRTLFLPKVGKKPDWAPWTAGTSLFVTWVGANDCAFSTDPSPAMNKLLELHEELYEAGARNIMFIDVPPINRCPGYSLAFSDTDRYEKWNTSLRQTMKKFASRHEDVTALLYSSHAMLTKILDNPETYGFPRGDVRKRAGSIWFDHLHPTSKVHDLIAEDVGDFLSSVGMN